MTNSGEVAVKRRIRRRMGILARREGRLRPDFPDRAGEEDKRQFKESKGSKASA